MILKNPFFFGCTIIILIALQVGASYLSFHFFLEGDWLLGFLFLICVPGLAFLMVLYFIWFRKKTFTTEGAEKTGRMRSVLKRKNGK